MSDQLDPALVDLIDTGRRKLKAIAARASEAWEALGNLLPDEVLYYAGRCSEVEPEGWNDVIYRLEIPGCSAITITLKREQTGIVDGQYTYAYQPSKNYKNGVDRGVYCVDYLDIVPLYEDGEQVGYTAGATGHHGYTDDLSVALASAAEQGAKMNALTAEAEAKTDEMRARTIGRQASIDQKQHAAEDRRLALIAKILDDDLAVRLVELFLAIQTDRDNWTATVRDATEHADSLAERYEQRLAEQQRQADLALRTRQNEVDIAQREADELQTKLDKLKRQAQFA